MIRSNVRPRHKDSSLSDPPSARASPWLCRHVVAFAAAGFLVVAVSGSIHAQVIVGVVRDAGNGTPLPSVHLTMLDSTGTARASAFTDSLGVFRLAGMGPGTFTLQAERLGVEPARTEAFTVNPNERLDVEFRLRPEAIELQPIVVRQRRRISPRLAEYYDRLERGGFGYFITREELERSGSPYVSSHLQMSPGVWVRGGIRPRITMRGTTGRCTPTVFLDGFRVPAAEVDALTTPDQLEGIEIYRGMHAPMQYGRVDCGAILMWTRVDDGRPLTWKRVLAAAALAVGMLFLSLQ